MPIINCAFCGKPKEVRQADLNRGWGRFCSKSCKAKWQANGRKTVPATAAEGIKKRHPEFFEDEDRMELGCPAEGIDCLSQCGDK